MRCKQFFCLLLCFCFLSPVFAFEGFSLSGGSGRPSGLVGGRLAGQWYWHKQWLHRHHWRLDGYWDMSMAYWRTNGNPDNDHEHKNLATVAFAPVLRYKRFTPLLNSIYPYVEASWGLALLTDQHLSYRNQGAHWTFQDLLGLGLQFGYQGRYDLSYHYLHYSNAGINPPNNGIDVKALISLQYRFS